MDGSSIRSYGTSPEMAAIDVASLLNGTVNDGIWWTTAIATTTAQNVHE